MCTYPRRRKLKKHYNYIILAVILFIFGAYLLYVPSPVGIADNTDFVRITKPVGIIPDNNQKFFYFQRKFEYIKPFNNLKDFVMFIFSSGIENESGFQSTQFLFVKIAQLLSGIISYLKNGSIRYFDITALSFIFLILHSISVVLLFYFLKTGNKVADIGIFLLTVMIFNNMGYLLYYNSLFGESVILSSFLLWFSILLYLVKSKKKSFTMLILYFISAAIFIGAKVANIPLGILIALLSIYFLFDIKTIGKRIGVIIGICFILATSIHYYQAIPVWMKKPNNFHSIFFGILKNSDIPDKDLRELGIDTKYSPLANTNVYVDLKGFDIYSEEFQKEVYDKAGPVEVTLYYLKHPKRLLEKLNISAESSLMIRPPYLGNYQIETYEEIVKFTKRNSIWEWIRKQFTGYAFAVITSLFLLYSAVLIYQLYLFRKQKNPTFFGLILVKLMLMVFAGSQWVFPVIGNGEADLIKHMFLFNLLFDTMIIVVMVDIIKLYRKNLIKKRIVLSSLGLLVIAIGSMFIYKEIDKNDLISFGKYNGKPITWEVLDETDSQIFVVAKDIVEYRPFSLENNNYWLESDIRKWLNDESQNGFLYEFSVQEKERISSTSRTTLISPAFINKKEFGSQPHYWFCIPGYVMQNYDGAYGAENEEKVFLLSAKEWDTYQFKKRKGVQYWLRTPYTMESIVRVVGEDGYVYHKKVGMDNIGVLPTLIISKPVY